MNEEILKIFQEFEQEGRLFTLHEANLKNTIPTNDPAQAATENYKRARRKGFETDEKRQRFVEYLNRRCDLLETLTQSVIASSGKELQATVEKALNTETRKLANKMIKCYFK